MAKSISLHPKLAGSVDAFLNILILFTLQTITEWWILGVWFFFRILLWILLIRLVYYPREIRRVGHFFSLLFFFLGLSLLLIFVEWNLSWYALGAVFVFFPWMSFWILPAEDKQLSFASKPYRRWRLIMNTFSVAGIWGGASAVISLDIFGLGSWIWILAGAVLSTALSVWWWLEYETEKSSRFWIWTVVWFLLFVELGSALFLLPLGYLVNGLIMSWVWYLLWLLARFHLSSEGVNWKKQAPFYVSNFLLLILFLILVVKWK